MIAWQRSLFSGTKINMAIMGPVFVRVLQSHSTPYMLINCNNVSSTVLRYGGMLQLVSPSFKFSPEIEAEKAVQQDRK